MALSDSNDIGLVITKSKLGKIGQGLLVADCHIDQLDGDAGAITLAAVLWMMTQRPLVAEGSC